jgi:hypothetical protein
MAASLYIDDNWQKAIAGYPQGYAPVDDNAQLYVARRSGGWRISRALGLIPLTASDTSNPNFLLFNPATGSPTTFKNQIVAMRFRVANTADQIGIIARGNNSPCNGFALLYNGSTNILQLARFFNSGGVQFGNHDSESWTPTTNTDYWLFLYARSTSGSDTTLRGWVTADTAKQTPLTSLVTSTDSLSELQTSGFWGPFTLSYNDGTAVSRTAMWTVDGTYTALGFATSSGSDVLLEAFPVDGTGPYTYQWQKASTPAGSYANITGATTARYSYTDGTRGVTEYFKCVITDTGAANATATSAAFSGAKLQSDLAIGVARDSYGARYPNSDDAGAYQLNPMPELMGKMLAANLNRSVTIVNGSVSGITAATFISTYMDDWIVDLEEAGVTYAEIAFGANSGSSDTSEAESDATAILVVADIETICEALISANITPIVSSAQYFMPTGRSGRGAQNLRTMELINEKLFDEGGLVDGTTILVGDQYLYDWTAANPDYLTDQLHWNEWANTLAASRISARLTAIIDATAIGVNSEVEENVEKILKIVQANAKR